MANAMKMPWDLPRNFPVAHKREKLGNTEGCNNFERWKLWRFEARFPSHLGMATLKLPGISPTTRSQRGSGVHCHFVAGGKPHVLAFRRFSSPKDGKVPRCDLSWFPSIYKRCFDLTLFDAPTSGGLCSTGLRVEALGVSFWAGDVEWRDVPSYRGQSWWEMENISKHDRNNWKIAETYWNSVKHDVLEVWNIFQPRCFFFRWKRKTPNLRQMPKVPWQKHNASADPWPKKVFIWEIPMKTRVFFRMGPPWMVVNVVNVGIPHEYFSFYGGFHRHGYHQSNMDDIGGPPMDWKPPHVNAKTSGSSHADIIIIVCTTKGATQKVPFILSWWLSWDNVIYNWDVMGISLSRFELVYGHGTNFQPWWLVG